MNRARRAWTLVTFATLFIAGPVLPLVIGRMERSKDESRDGRAPRRELPPDPLVEVIGPAYLESSTVGPSVDRLVETLTTAGLRHRVHVVASDEETALAAAGASVVTLSGRSGKTAPINLGVGGPQADVIVLTDLNCEIQPADWPSIMLAELTECDLVSGSCR